ncbi:MAG: DUF3343 domain-containing protein [Tissierellia bacterium]|nr:DUF3343 domain-containing protein [Tissierellia bacterium]
MLNREFGVITFKSTNYAMKSELAFKNEEIVFRTIPTPREITHSCGLAIRFDLRDVDLAKEIVDKNHLNIDGIFKVVKTENGSFAEKLN